MMRRSWISLVVGTLVLSVFPTTAQKMVPTGGGQVVIITGPPGSGKSLQADKLGKKYKVPVISLSKLVQDGAKNHQKVAGVAAAALASGEMLADDAAIQLLGARINQPDAARGFILDGYPISEAQARFLDQFVINNKLQAPKVAVLEATDEVVRTRLLKRRRADDSPENIDRRLKEYHQEEAFLNAWYKPANTVRVDATLPPEQVFSRMEEGLIELFRKKDFKGRAPAAQ